MMVISILQIAVYLESVYNIITQQKKEMNSSKSRSNQKKERRAKKAMSKRVLFAGKDAMMIKFKLKTLDIFNV